MTTMADPDRTMIRPKSHSFQRAAPVKASAAVVAEGVVDVVAPEDVVGEVDAGAAELGLPEPPELVGVVDVGPVVGVGELAST